MLRKEKEPVGPPEPRPPTEEEHHQTQNQTGRRPQRPDLRNQAGLVMHFNWREGGQHPVTIVVLIEPVSL